MRYSQDISRRARFQHFADELSARMHRWKSSTGPRTPAGKANVALNGRARQKGKYSVRQKRAMTAETRALINRMAALRRQLQAEMS
jgi:hypothetical protein